LIGEGNHARVWCNVDESLVRKTFTAAERARAGRLAEREFAALMTAAEALHPVSGVRSPIPYTLDRDGGQLIMEYCPGSPIYNVINHPRFGNNLEIRRLATQLGNAIVRLSECLGRDELDFSIRNTLISDDLEEIILIDFANRADRLLNATAGNSLEVSLGSFIAGVAIYHVHRESIFRRTNARRLRMLSREMLDHVSSMRNVDRDAVREIAWRLYWRQSGDRGWKRFLWFHSTGRLIFRTHINNMVAPGPPCPAEARG
jgi:tRNA A-37 threonylcarbamoyl transferase component Bud32